MEYKLSLEAPPIRCSHFLRLGQELRPGASLSRFCLPISLPILFIIAASLCWGGASAMTKSIVATVDPLLLIVLQLTASITFLWLLVFITGRVSRGIKDGVILGSMGILEPGLAYLLSTIGLTFTSASAASLIFATEPALVALVAWFVLQEKISARTTKILFVTMFGVGLTSYGENSLDHHLIGDFLVIGSTLCAAVYVVFNQRFVTRLDPLLVAALQQTWGLVFAALILIIYSIFVSTAPLALPQTHTLYWIALSGIIQYGLAFWFYLIAVRSLPVTVATLFLSLIPLVTITAGNLFLGERLNSIQMLGAAITLGAMLRLRRQTTKVGSSFLQSSH